MLCHLALGSRRRLGCRRRLDFTQYIGAFEASRNPGSTDVVPDRALQLLFRYRYTNTLRAFTPPIVLPMRTSQFPIQTLKETPADAEIASHRLMLRAGMIRKLA
ncbi:hypothetical protein, partial [Thiocapsa sp.]|uniref:hypothetical protein n=1 Tax=Thiocapsa sp. TaxID=2024551 RepID=UPI0035943AB1